MRCVCVDGITSFIHPAKISQRVGDWARALMEFRQLEESSDKPGECCTLLVMFDNSNQDTAEKLKIAIVDEFKKRSIWGDGTIAQVIMLYLIGTTDTELS